MENIILNLILDTDSYKLSHFKQYPPKTTHMISYLEAREGGKFKETVFFGLQYYMEKYLTTTITVEMVEEANTFAHLHAVPFNYKGWMRIAKELDGNIPIKIKAVPEGMVVPEGNILLKVESTDPETFWVVSHFETLLVRLWYPITVATLSRECKKVIYKSLLDTAEAPDEAIDFMLHDFGSRGVSSQESAMIGGASHLVNFRGSDTLAGVWMANKYYDIEMSAFSIPASEHSTMTAWGQDNEVEAYRNMLKQYGDNGILAVVSDSYDIHNAVKNLWGHELKKEVIDSGALVIIRPDSGYPPTIVLEILQELDSAFGHTINSKGYKVLNNVKVIQGDGIDYEMIATILRVVTTDTSSAHFSASNLAFGMGGGLLQQVNRDTQCFAFKACRMTIDGKNVDIFKAPKTDMGKASKRGDLMLVSTKMGIKTVPADDKEDDLLEYVYENGEILKRTTFDEVRIRASI